VKILITIPCRNEQPMFYMKYWNRWLRWCYDFEDETHNKVRILPETTPNRMDVSLSKCIELAKNPPFKDPKWIPDWWVRLDSDIWPESELGPAFAAAVETWEKWKGITAVPTVDRRGVLQFEPEGKVSSLISSVIPFPCNWVSGSLVFTPREVVNALQPVSVYHQMFGDHQESMNLYIAVQRPTTTEDYDYCERVRAEGFSVYANPNILARQLRPDMGIPSFRQGMTVGGKVHLQVQGVGVA
jgi:hypothetical protein